MATWPADLASPRYTYTGREIDSDIGQLIASNPLRVADLENVTSATLWLLLGAAALAAASTLFKRRKVKELPDISDEDFVSLYRVKFNSSDGKEIEERKAIAKCLGIPPRKLSPSQTLKSLSKYTGFITEYEIGISDLGDELAHVFKQAGLKSPDRFPETVGELIHETIKAKQKSRDYDRPSHDI